MDMLADGVLDCKINASAGVHMNTDTAFTTHVIGQLSFSRRTLCSCV